MYELMRNAAAVGTLLIIAFVCALALAGIALVAGLILITKGSVIGGVALTLFGGGVFGIFGWLLLSPK